MISRGASEPESVCILPGGRRRRMTVETGSGQEAVRLGLCKTTTAARGPIRAAFPSRPECTIGRRGAWCLHSLLYTLIPLDPRRAVSHVVPSVARFGGRYADRSAIAPVSPPVVLDGTEEEREEDLRDSRTDNCGIDERREFAKSGAPRLSPCSRDHGMCLIVGLKNARKVAVV